ncbi:MAG: ABC transporter permease [Opitutales bacterium]|nr:ABC transporter permease [Opitutales bacterium]
MKRILYILLLSIRQSMRSPVNTLLCILVLAGSIALVTTMFSICAMLFLSSYPYEMADRIVIVEKCDKQKNCHWQWSVDSYRMMEDASADVFEHLIPTFKDTVFVQNGSIGQNLGASYVAWDFDKSLQVEPILGRTFTQEDAATGAEPVVIIGEKIWDGFYERDRNVIGKSIVVDGRARTIVGVMPAIMEYPIRERLWIPLNLETLKQDTGWAEMVFVIGIINEGLSVEQAEEMFQPIAQEISKAYPKEHFNTEKAELLRMNDTLRSPSDIVLFGTLFACSILVLFTGCGIASGLLTARYAERSQELAIRSALGASRAQIVTQIMLEFTLLSTSAIILGHLTSRYIGASILSHYLGVFDMPVFIARSHSIMLLPFTIAILIIVTASSTIVPALRATKTDIRNILRESTRTGSSLRLTKLSNLLISWQVATSCIVLNGCALIGYSLYSFNHECKYFDPADYIGATVSFNSNKHHDDHKRAALMAEIMKLVREHPQIEKAAISTEYFNYYQWGVGTKVWPEGKTYKNEIEAPTAIQRVISPGYFDATNTPLISGREFNESDDYDHPLVAIVNDSFAMEHFGTLDVIGKSIGVHGQDEQHSIVAVVPDTMDDVYIEGKLPVFYLPYATTPWYDLTMIIKSDADIESIKDHITNSIGMVDKDTCLTSIMPLNKQRDKNGHGDILGFVFVLFSMFSIGTLIMTIAGLYGVISFSLNVRKQEMGIRLSLGASPTHIVTGLAKQSFIYICIGMAFGLAGTLGMRILLTQCVIAMPESLLVYVLTMLALMLMCLVAVILPALRQADCEPSDALRT